MKKGIKIFIAISIIMIYSIGRSNAACNQIAVDCGDGTGTIFDICDGDDITTEEVVDLAVDFCS